MLISNKIDKHDSISNTKKKENLYSLKPMKFNVISNANIAINVICVTSKPKSADDSVEATLISSEYSEYSETMVINI
jgi:hypothetical protein